jgi:hypothetical protein
LIVEDQKTGIVTIVLGAKRKLQMSKKEFENLSHLITNPPKKIEINDPLKLWSPCTGPDCTHPSHGEKVQDMKEMNYRTSMSCAFCRHSREDYIDEINKRTTCIILCCEVDEVFVCDKYEL